MKRELTTFDLVFRNFLVALTLRAIWQSYPGIFPCLLFWGYHKFGDPIFIRGLSLRRRVLHLFAFIGATLNAIATLANGGYMPVLGKVAEGREVSVWVPLTSASHLPALCDIYRGGTSLGDLLIFFALAGFLLNWICEKNGWISHTVHGERLPGLGI